MNIQCMTFDGIFNNISGCLFTFYIVEQMYAPRITVIFFCKNSRIYLMVFLLIWGSIWWIEK